MISVSVQLISDLALIPRAPNGTKTPLLVSVQLFPDLTLILEENLWMYPYKAVSVQLLPDLALIPCVVNLLLECTGCLSSTSLRSHSYSIREEWKNRNL